VGKKIIHDEACPALCPERSSHAHLNYNGHEFIGTDHLCRCTAAAELRDLVEAYSRVANIFHESDCNLVRGFYPIPIEQCDKPSCVKALQRLAPFREQEEK
jgi:hypothetical protein